MGTRRRWPHSKYEAMSGASSSGVQMPKRFASSQCHTDAGFNATSGIAKAAQMKVLTTSAPRVGRSDSCKRARKKRVSSSASSKRGTRRRTHGRPRNMAACAAAGLT